MKSIGLALGVVAVLGAVGCSGSTESGERLGESNQATALGLVVNASTYASDGKVTVNYSGMSGAYSDWIAIAPVGSPATTYSQWLFTKGGTSGSLVFNQLSPGGPYEARAYYDWSQTRSTTIQQTSAPFSLEGAGGVATDAAIYAPSATVTVNFTNLPVTGPFWMGLAASGSANTQYLSWKNLTGPTGSTTFTAPVPLGSYVMRAFYAGTYALMSASPAFVVGTPPPPPPPPTTPSVTATASIAKATPIVVTFANFNGAKTDWITVAATGAAATAYSRYAYTNGGTTGSVTLSNNLAAGSYEIRGYFNWNGTHSYTIQATRSLTITP